MGGLHSRESSGASCLPTLFTVLGGGPAIKSVQGLPACLPFAPGAHDNKAEVDPFRTGAPEEPQAIPLSSRWWPGSCCGFTAASGHLRRGNQVVPREEPRVPGAEEEGWWKGSWPRVNIVSTMYVRTHLLRDPGLTASPV